MASGYVIILSSMSPGPLKKMAASPWSPPWSPHRSRTSRPPCRRRSPTLSPTLSAMAQNPWIVFRMPGADIADEIATDVSAFGGISHQAGKDGYVCQAGRHCWHERLRLHRDAGATDDHGPSNHARLHYAGGIQAARIQRRFLRCSQSGDGRHLGHFRRARLARSEPGVFGCRPPTHLDPDAVPPGRRGDFFAPVHEQCISATSRNADPRNALESARTKTATDSQTS